VTVTALKPAPDFQSPVSGEEILPRSLIVYPNPVSNKCVVQFDGAFSKVSTKIYDIRGSLVRTWSARIIGKGSIELDMRGIGPGQYIVELNDGNKRWAVKLLKL